MNNFKVVIEYNGNCYSGIQRQSKGVTVESEFLKALRSIYKKDIKIIYSGRTDAGVHSVGQVINYKTELSIPLESLKKAFNSALPFDINVLTVDKVDLVFNARRSAMSREYQYLFSKDDIPFYMKSYITKIAFEPIEKLFERVSSVLIGEHDFKHLYSLGSNEKSTIRTIYEFNITKTDHKSFYNSAEVCTIYKIKIIANSYLYRMVRHIVGAIFEVIKGKEPVGRFKEYLYGQNKLYYYTVAKAIGLCLVKVNYNHMRR